MASSVNMISAFLSSKHLGEVNIKLSPASALIAKQIRGEISYQATLVGVWTNPFEKLSQIGSVPQVGMKLKKICETTT